MKVIVFDPISSGKSHFNFNLIIIKIITESENISSVDVLLSKSQSDELNQSESLDNIKIKKVHGINDSNNNKSVFHFLIYSLIIYFSLFINILNKKPKSLYVLASDNLLSPIFLFLITFFTKIKVYVFLHNNLESIENSNLKKKLLLTNLNKGLIGICLSNFVLQKAKQLLDNNINLLCFPHPSYSHLLMKNLVKRNHFENDFLLLGRHSVYFTENNFHMNLFSTINDLVKKDQIVILLRKNSNSNYKGQNFIVSEYDYPLSDDDYWSLLLNSNNFY